MSLQKNVQRNSASNEVSKRNHHCLSAWGLNWPIKFDLCVQDGSPGLHALHLGGIQMLNLLLLHCSSLHHLTARVTLDVITLMGIMKRLLEFVTHKENSQKQLRVIMTFDWRQGFKTVRPIKNSQPPQSLFHSWRKDTISLFVTLQSNRN